jgi:hypothetical protein
MARDLDDAEERCLEAEAWADEISAWGREMVTAIVKSIRLSVVAGEDRDTREFLLEELDQLLAKYRSPISSGEHLKPDLNTLDDIGEIEDLPASVKPTLPPPPGMAPEEIWKNAPQSVPGKRR